MIKDRNSEDSEMLLWSSSLLLSVSVTRLWFLGSSFLSLRSRAVAVKFLLPLRQTLSVEMIFVYICSLV